jgi:hypothetical protein
MTESNTFNVMAESTPSQSLSILETITNITLTNSQTDTAVKIIEDAGNEITIRRFVDLSLQMPDLKEFAESVTYHCLADNDYKNVFESKVAEMNLSHLERQGN